MDDTPNTVTGSNSDTVSFNYTAYRQKRVTKPDGSYVSYNFSDWDINGNPVYPPGNWSYPYVSTTTSYLGKISKTILDGFGRPLFQMARETASPEVWITTKTEYVACSCSTTGKTFKTSRPYKSDANGSPLSGQTVYWTTSTFDALGRPTQVELPDGNKTSYEYTVKNDADPKGTLTKVTPPKLITDPTGKPKRYLNDTFGRLVRVEEPKPDLTLAKTAEYTFDVMGRMTDAWTFKRDGTASQHRTFVYNTFGQLYTATNPENGTVTYTYYSDGLLATKTDAKNQTLWFFYDTNHRLLRIESPQGTVKTQFTYDSATNGVGKLATASNDGNTWRFGYDIMGRVTTQTIQWPIYSGQDLLTATAQYGFDYDGQFTNLYYPGIGYAPPGGSVAVGTQHQYAYDAVGRATSLQYYSGGWITAAQNAQYNAAGQITSWQESSTTLSRTYDAARGWVNNISAGSVLNLTYSYQPDGRVSAVTDGVNSAYSATYGYDELNRLTSASTSGWGLAWTYDDFGNRLTQSATAGTPPTSTLAFANNDNRISSGGYGYDANGNLTSMPGFTNMQYDVFDRLTSATATSSYKYDAFGRRVWRWTPDGSQHVYFYDPGGRLLSEFVVGGATTTYRYFAGQRIGHYTDRIGNVRYANGVARHYYPYGEEITSTNSDTYKFAQLHRDSDTGLDYAMARYAASTLGRFLTPDPVGAAATQPENPASWNLYHYSLNDPINVSDPSGLVALLDLIFGANAPVGATRTIILCGDEDHTPDLQFDFVRTTTGYTLTTKNLQKRDDPGVTSTYEVGNGSIWIQSDRDSEGGTQSYTPTVSLSLNFYGGSWLPSIGSPSNPSNSNSKPYIPADVTALWGIYVTAGNWDYSGGGSGGFSFVVQFFSNAGWLAFSETYSEWGDHTGSAYKWWNWDPAGVLKSYQSDAAKYHQCDDRGNPI